jgi:hypothetical protein
MFIIIILGGAERLWNYPIGEYLDDDYCKTTVISIELVSVLPVWVRHSDL